VENILYKSGSQKVELNKLWRQHIILQKSFDIERPTKHDKK